MGCPLMASILVYAVQLYANLGYSTPLRNAGLGTSLVV